MKKSAEIVFSENLSKYGSDKLYRTRWKKIDVYRHEGNFLAIPMPWSEKFFSQILRGKTVIYLSGAIRD